MLPRQHGYCSLQIDGLYVNVKATWRRAVWDLGNEEDVRTQFFAVRQLNEKAVEYDKEILMAFRDQEKGI